MSRMRAFCVGVGGRDSVDVHARRWCWVFQTGAQAVVRRRCWGVDRFVFADARRCGLGCRGGGKRDVMEALLVTSSWMVERVEKVWGMERMVGVERRVVRAEAPLVGCRAARMMWWVGEERARFLAHE